MVFWNWFHLCIYFNCLIALQNTHLIPPSFSDQQMIYRCAYAHMHVYKFINAYRHVYICIHNYIEFYDEEKQLIVVHQWTWVVVVCCQGILVLALPTSCAGTLTNSKPDVSSSTTAVARETATTTTRRPSVKPLVTISSSTSCQINLVCRFSISPTFPVVV